MGGRATVTVVQRRGCRSRGADEAGSPGSNPSPAALNPGLDPDPRSALLRGLAVAGSQAISEAWKSFQSSRLLRFTASWIRVSAGRPTALRIAARVSSSWL